MTDPVQAIVGTDCCWYYHGSWCTDTLCIASVNVIWKMLRLALQCNLIWELMLHKFEQSHHTVKATKNTYWVKVWLGWVWFYGISTILGYIMPNPLYTYILNI